MSNTDVTKTVPGAPVDVFDAMRQEMNRLIDSFDRGWPGTGLFKRSAVEGMGLAIDVRDGDKALIIEADIPGIEEKDVSVTLANCILTISGEKKSEREEKKTDYYLSERSFGSFRRSLRLPDTIDESKVEAHFDKGVLTITAHKKPEAATAERRIEIKKA